MTARSPISTAIEGILLHRGYPIEQLAENSSFLEVAYLLLNGELPTAAEKAEFEDGIMHHTMVHEQLRSFYNGFRRDAHPMAVCCGVVGALSAFYHDSLDINNPDHRRISAFRLIAKLPTIAAWTYKYAIGQPFIYPRNDLSYAANFLHMLHAVPAEPYAVSPVLEKAMDRIFILHADHEQNASTSTVRLAGSTGANPFACIAAGIASLWGPAHGGANEAVLKMLDEIGDPKHIPDFISKVKDKTSHIRLMGFGHRVYKNYDPRAKIMQETCHEVLPSSASRTTRRSTSPWSWSASRCMTTTSSARSSTRTSTSTLASSSRRWASRPQCSPSSSPSLAPSAGSASGRR